MTDAREPAPGDEALMERYVRGDVSAFEEIFRRYEDLVLRMMRRGYVDAAQAEDLAQQTFLQLHRARHDYTAGRPLRPWLLTIARNVKRDHLRRVQRRRPTLGLEGYEPAGPDPAASRLEARDAVRHALSTLPATLRSVVELHWLQHLPFGEVARRLGISRSAAKVRAHRAYRALRERLAGTGESPESRRSRGPGSNVLEGE